MTISQFRQHECCQNILCLAKVFLLLVFIDVGKKSKVTHSSVHQSNNVPISYKGSHHVPLPRRGKVKTFDINQIDKNARLLAHIQTFQWLKSKTCKNTFFVFLTSLVVVVGSKMITTAPVWEIFFFAFWCLVVCVLKVSPQHLSRRFFLSLWCLVICGKKILLQHLPGRSKPQARTHCSWSSVGGHHIYLDDNDGGKDDDNDG